MVIRKHIVGILYIVIVAFLLIGVCAGSVPDIPILIHPEEGATLQDTNVILIVSVNDLDGDWMNVTFNSSAGTPIGYSFVNGSGDAGCTWFGLTAGIYQWNANATDSEGSNQSLTFSFTIAAATPITAQDEKYIPSWSNMKNTTGILNTTMLPYVNTIGLGWFVALFTFMTVGMIAIKTQEFLMPSIILLLMVGCMSIILPLEIQTPMMIMAGLTFAGIIALAFKRRIG